MSERQCTHRMYCTIRHKGIGDLVLSPSTSSVHLIHTLQTTKYHERLMNVWLKSVHHHHESWCLFRPNSSSLTRRLQCSRHFAERRMQTKKQIRRDTRPEERKKNKVFGKQKETNEESKEEPQIIEKKRMVFAVVVDETGFMLNLSLQIHLLVWQSCNWTLFPFLSHDDLDRHQRFVFVSDSS